MTWPGRLPFFLQLPITSYKVSCHDRHDTVPRHTRRVSLMILLDTSGPALMLGDCLAPTLVLTPNTAPCPVCGEHADDVKNPSGGPMRATLVSDVAYGTGVLVPCGHEIGGITTDAALMDAAR